MGKGDRRSRKGKIWRHSYGNTRKKKNGTKPAFVPKAKKEKKVSSPEAVEAQGEEEAKKAPAKKKPAAKKAAPKKKEE